MSDILYISHRVPYPPNKGDKIRSFNFIKHLAAHHDVHLGTFMDDPADRAHLETLHELCASVCVIELAPFSARLRSLSGFFSGEPLTARYYRNRRLRHWIRRLAAERPLAAVICSSSGVGTYALQPMAGSPLRIVDFVDVDSDKWRQYSRGSRGPLRYVYARESAKLAAAERRMALASDASLFVSTSEADFFRRHVPALVPKVHALSNGVDADFFDLRHVTANPYDGSAPVAVFTGMMDYRANIEGVTWFARRVFPRVREAVPDAQFYIVGARPTAAVRSLAAAPGVHVTGRVDDVRPYVAHAHVAVAPLKIARGIQNKVLEALAMCTPVVGTPQAFEGIAEFPSRADWTAGDPDAFAAAVSGPLSVPRPRQPDMRLRDFVLEHYDWDRNLSFLDVLIEGRAAHAPATTPAGPALPAYQFNDGS